VEAGEAEVRHFRVLISHQGCVPIYRKSFYELLNKDSTTEYVVAYGPAPSGSDITEASPPFNFPNIPVKNHCLKLGHQVFIWQQLVFRAISGNFDAVIVGDEVKVLSNVIIAIIFWILRRPVLLWGLGFHWTEELRTWREQCIAACAYSIKNGLYSIASGYLVYTDGGAAALRGYRRGPKRITVLKNTVDVKRETEFRRIVASEPLVPLLCELAVRASSVKLLYFGRLVRWKHVELLISYATRCLDGGKDVELIIFGRGAEETSLRRAAIGMPNVVFHQHEDLKLARALRVSAAVVIPGVVGLASTHAFAHGVPMITRENQQHGPEIEYLKHGLNGLILPEEPNLFFEGLDSFVSDVALQQRLALGAEQSGQVINMTDMLASFRSLITTCLEDRENYHQARQRQ
jgi:glycosyltransferase involved in cell wall biosynthesis